MISPTLNLELAAARLWDVLVVGAGPAGSLAAREIARRGLQVLLVDKASFPRWKVCGCCLNGRSRQILTAVGLRDLPAQLGGVPLRRLMLASRKRRARMEIQAGIAVSRPAFDGGLLEAALKMGTDFLPETCASLGQSAGETRTVVLRQHERTAEIKSRLVLLADGLGGRFFQRARRPEMVIEKNSWIGAGVVVPSAPEFYCTHAIFMACGSHGYVGLVRLEDGHLNIAAAFDPRFVKHWHHPGRAAETILADAGFPPIVGLSQWDWRGTPPLTRRISPRAMHRIFVLGDAAGYVQPFTGEGIGWALAAGLAVSDLAIRGAEQWHASLEREWHHLYQKTVASRQFLCKALALVLRHRILTSAMIAVLFRFPKAANPFLRRLHLNSAQLRPNLQFKASSWDRN